uniref:Uncharacterized protein n=1 Tax=Zea mays TaxID=4577 RepID=C4J2A4_MAIZE|nr:unknown [Zea mays]
MHHLRKRDAEILVNPSSTSYTLDLTEVSPSSNGYEPRLLLLVAIYSSSVLG